MGRLTEIISFINDFDDEIPINKYKNIDIFRYNKSKKKYKSFYTALYRTDDNVYLIGNLEEKVVKIGKSDCIRLRLNQIQTYCHFELSVLKTTTGLLEKEEDLHKRFKKYNIRGEWFRIEGELEDYINEPNWRWNGN